MAVKPINTLLALKVLTYAPGLTANARAVGAVIVDRYNRKSGQCDPGLDGIAAHLGINSRTVMRSVSRLEVAGLLRKLRHGGHGNRNQYEPIWERFNALEEEWRARLKQRRSPADQKLSSSPRQGCHLEGDGVVTQTYRSNLHKLTYSRSRPNEEIGKECSSTSKAIAFTPRFRDASEAEAERRWTTALHECFGSLEVTYGEIIEVITPEIQAEATAVELTQRGSGIAFVLRRLKLGPDPRRDKEQ
jgi:hypothetical protein